MGTTTQELDMHNSRNGGRARWIVSGAAALVLATLISA
jgi:hypothetical protein